MIRDVFEIYNRNLILILFLCIFMVIPISMFMYFLDILMQQSNIIELKNVFSVFLITLNFAILFPAFFYVTKNDLLDNPVKIRHSFLFFAERFGVIFLITAVIYFLSVFSFFLLFIPTIIGMAMIILIPLFSEKERVSDILKGVWGVILKENVFILIDLLLIFSINAVVWVLITSIVTGLETNTMVYVFLRAFVNSIVYPFIFIYLTLKYRQKDIHIQA